MSPLKQQAIQTALTGDWNSAVTLNQMLLEENPEDIDTLNRLAFAFSSLGNIKEAKNLYQKVLTLDTQNPIALRNLKRLGDTNGKMTSVSPILMNNIFIEEPGKTKVVELINLAEQKVITQLRCGESLALSGKRMKVFVLGNDKQYIGMLPDDLGRRLLKFIDGGNQYEAYVKTVDNHKMTIFIKEVKRSARFKNQPSFITLEKTKLFYDSKAGQERDDDEKRHSEDAGDSF